jgi:hypothetical protein
MGFNGLFAAQQFKGVRMSQMGQNRKSSTRANVFCSAPNNGDCATVSACPFCAAKSGSDRRYSITSSARNKIEGGTVRLSTLAVLAFTASSNFTGT